MADVSRGPVASMPGSRCAPPAGATCDDHPDRPAVKRLQGETDSFGCEYLDLCQGCVDAIDAGEEERRSGVCDWCKSDALDLRHHRDLDEGMAGPVYRVCGGCRNKEAKLLQAELDERDGWDDYSDIGDDA